MMLQPWIVEMTWRHDGTRVDGASVSSTWPVGVHAIEVLREAAESRGIDLAKCHDVRVATAGEPYEEARAPEPATLTPSSTPVTDAAIDEAVKAAGVSLVDSLRAPGTDPTAVTHAEDLAIHAVANAMYKMVAVFKYADPALGSSQVEAMMLGTAAARPYILELLRRRLREAQVH